MTARLQHIIDEARALSPEERIEAMQALSGDCPHSLRSAAFWRPREIQDIAGEQQAPPITSIGDLTTDFWPGDESTDDLLEFVREQRHADGARNA